MIKIETSSKKSNHKTNKNASLMKPAENLDESLSEDKLSLLVKAAEKLVNEQDNQSTESNSQMTTNSSTSSSTKLNELSTNFSKLNAFVNTVNNSAKTSSTYPVFLGKNGKPTRPFKAYPKESLSLPIGGQSTSFKLLNDDTTSHQADTSPSTQSSSSSSNSPITDTQALLPTNNLITPENLLSLISTLLQNNSQTDLNSLLLSMKQNSDDLTSLNLNDLTTFDISSLAFSPNDFCVQHRKRIQQAQDRLVKKQQLTPIDNSDEVPSSRRRSSFTGARKRSTNNHDSSSSSSLERSPSSSKQIPVVSTSTCISENQVDSTCSGYTQPLVVDVSNYNEDYLNYPPKKRHRIQQQHQERCELENIKNNLNETEQISSISSSSSSSSPLVSSTVNKSQSELILVEKSNSPPLAAMSSCGSTTQRSRQSSVDLDDKDTYRERRRKNNEAAKRSRDARRAKEDDIALRAALLERENLQLKVEISQLKQETSRLRCMLYNS